MPCYTINYRDGDTDVVEAEQVDYDVDACMFTFHSTHNIVALVPEADVRIVKRHDETLKVRIEGTFEELRDKVAGDVRNVAGHAR